jgi:hypothetical protein
MPSPWHDAITELVRENPAFAVRLLSLTGMPVETELPARLESSIFNDRLSTDFASDTVVVAGSSYDPVRGIVVEAQQTEDGNKLELSVAFHGTAPGVAAAFTMGVASSPKASPEALPRASARRSCWFSRPAA